jgi:hypothetical protein
VGSLASAREEEGLLSNTASVVVDGEASRGLDFDLNLLPLAGGGAADFFII